MKEDACMKIAQIAPLAESVPPRLYGGTERIVSYLTEELVRQGHDVTLFASGDSRTSAKLVPITDMALRLNPGVVDPIPWHMMLLEAVRRRADEFDALHFHIDMLHLPMIQDFIGRTVTTLHGRLDLPDLPAFYRTFANHCLVSISDHQRLPMPPVNWGGTIYHGLPAGLLPPRLEGRGGGYLAFLGRISPEKTAGPRHPHRRAVGHAIENRGQDRRGRPCLLGAGDRPADRTLSQCRLYRRDQ